VPITVAIVEDSRVIRESLQRIINDSPGLRCECAVSTGEEALIEVPRCHPDVVLMDIHLPNISGIDCTRKLKEAVPETEVIMLTVYEEIDNIIQALKAGASGYLLKRTPAEQLVQAIKDVKAGGVPMTSEIARRLVEAFHRLAETASQTPVELTRREREILELVSQGYGNKDIADRLSVSVETVRHHLKRVYQKFHVHSRSEAVVQFIGRNGRTPEVPPGSTSER
jgi:DNA-binding NarL/FixJ family response regulator